ncbi:MAG: glycogen debranching enzyme family protein [Phycisphaeraceae bacterium]|nr:glycogen debranching enzyme family protein [Phycisphaeraceae bacterium]
MHSDFITHDLKFNGADDALREREWLLTNGTGAFAMGTAAGINTRRYHGLLIASTKPPVGRVMTLNQVLEEIQIGSETIGFTSCLFQGSGGELITEPHGDRWLRRFERGLGVRWTYRHERVEMTRTLSLHWKEQAATIRYRVKMLPSSAKDKPTQPVNLRLAPMLTLRDFHSLSRRDDVESLTAAQAGMPTVGQAGKIFASMATPPTLARTADAVTVRRPAATVTLRCPGSRFTGHAQWWYAVHYPVDRERGQDDHEDYYLPGQFEAQIDPAGETQIVLTVALGDHAAPPAPDDDKIRIDHLRPMLEKVTAAVGKAGQKPAASVHGGSVSTPTDPKLPTLLTLAADDFVVDRFFQGERLATVVAGYPWFADWGRDTFIAFHGLFLTTGRYADARSCLKTFANAIQGGLIPNLFNDYDDTAARYNTVDASLWYIHAAVEYVNASGDTDAWSQWLCAACVSIIEAYIRGTGGDDDAAPLIRMAGDGLITAGAPWTQLTWMDAASGGVIFTPRAGKAVDINALWFNALTVMTAMLTKHPPLDPARAQHYRKLTGRITRSFAKVFWDEERRHLIDHVWVDAEGVEHRDVSLRPNQLLTVSLPNSPIPRTRQADVMAAVKSELLTPYGLRTLPESDPHYHAIYSGPQFERDSAYHQGTIWPWLIGPYAEAVLRIGRFSDSAKAEARGVLLPLLDFMRKRSLGQLYEIHEARWPHRPVGCMAQAWSVAELLRVLALC